VNREATARRNLGAAHGQRWACGAWLGAALALLATHGHAETRSVAVSTANFRAGPSPEEPILFTADRYYPVEVIGQAKEWVRVRDFQGDEAWVSAALLRPTRTVVVTADVVNVRDEPSRDAVVVHTAEQGAAFVVAGRRGPWVSVADAEGEIGWIHEGVLWGSLDWSP
jgi:SH3-like domain-containing protein